MLDHQWIGDHWWNAATATGRFHIGSHSWDHLSPSVSPVAQQEGRTGSFKWVTAFADADVQVRRAHEFIAARAPNPGAALFAYPYGDGSDYLIDEYLPAHGARWRHHRGVRDRCHARARRQPALAPAALHPRTGLAVARRSPGVFGA